MQSQFDQFLSQGDQFQHELTPVNQFFPQYVRTLHDRGQQYGQVVSSVHAPEPFVNDRGMQGVVYAEQQAIQQGAANGCQQGYAIEQQGQANYYPFNQDYDLPVGVLSTTGQSYVATNNPAPHLPPDQFQHPAGPIPCTGDSGAPGTHVAPANYVSASGSGDAMASSYVATEGVPGGNTNQMITQSQQVPVSSGVLKARNTDTSSNSQLQNESGGKDVGSNKKDHKNARQRQLNQKAQQRYRVRKKERAQEMEQQIDELNQKLQHMESLVKRSEAERARTTTLERELLERNVEIQTLKAKLEVPATKSAASSDVNDSANTDSKVDDMDSIPPNADKDDTKDEAKAHMDQFSKLVANLSHFLKANHVDRGNSTNPVHGVDPAVQAAAKEHVQDVMFACLQVMNTRSVDTWPLITRLGVMGQCAGDEEGAALAELPPQSRDDWHDFVRALHLNKSQQAQMHLARSAYMTYMDEILVERQGLNLNAVALLLPSSTGGQAPGMDMDSTENFHDRAQHRVLLGSVLKQLKENLRKEQVAIAKLDFWLHNQVLLPLQGAWFIEHCYPTHCDSVSLVNAVRELYPVSDVAETAGIQGTLEFGANKPIAVSGATKKSVAKRLFSSAARPWPSSNWKLGRGKVGGVKS